MTLKELFFGDNAVEKRKLYNKNHCFEFRYTSKTMRLHTTNTSDGVTYLADFENDIDYPNFYDYHQKKHILEFVCGGRYCGRGMDTSIIIYLTESDLNEELELNTECDALCFTLQENKLRDFRLDLLIYPDTWEEIQEKLSKI